MSKKNSHDCGWPTRFYLITRAETHSSSSSSNNSSHGSCANRDSPTSPRSTPKTTYYVPRQATHSSFGYLPGCYRSNRTSRLFAATAAVYVRSRHLFMYVRTEYRVAEQCGTCVVFFFWFPGGGLKKTFFSVSGNRHGLCRLQTEQGDERPNCRSLPWPIFAADAASGLLVFAVYHAFWCVVFGTCDNT